MTLGSERHALHAKYSCMFQLGKIVVGGKIGGAFGSFSLFLSIWSIGAARLSGSYKRFVWNHGGGR